MTKVLIVIFFLLPSIRLFADQIQLKDSTTIEGSIAGFTDHGLLLSIGEVIIEIPCSDVNQIILDENSPIRKEDINNSPCFSIEDKASISTKEEDDLFIGIPLGMVANGLGLGLSLNKSLSSTFALEADFLSSINDPGLLISTSLWMRLFKIGSYKPEIGLSLINSYFKDIDYHYFLGLGISANLIHFAFSSFFLSFLKISLPFHLYSSPNVQVLEQGSYIDLPTFGLSFLKIAFFELGFRL